MLQFGLVEVFGGTASNPQPTLCPNGAGGYVPTGGVELNGIVLSAGLVGTLVLTPSGNGGTVAIDGQKIINSVAKGPAATTLATLTQSSLTLTVQPDNGAVNQNQQQPLATQSGSGSVGGFAIDGSVTLSLTLSQASNGTKVYGTALGLTVKLPSIFHKTNGTAAEGTVVVSAANENPDGTPNSTGLRLAGAQIVIGTAPAGSGLPAGTGGVWLGPVKLTYLCLSYTGIVGGVPSCASTNPSNSSATFVDLLQASQNCSPPPLGDSWDGQLEIKLPGIGSGLQIDAVAGTLAGKFHYAAAYVGGLSVPLYPSVTMDQIGFGVCLIPSTAPWGGGFKLDGLIGLKIANVLGGSILLEYQTTKNKVLSGKVNHVVPGTPPFDAQKTKWYVDAKGTLTLAASGALIGNAEIYVDPNAIGVTGMFGGTWTASGSVGSLSGSAAATIAAAVSGQVSLTNNAFNFFSYVNASASGTFSVATSLLGFGVNLSASASAAGNGTLAISDYGFGACLNLSGNASGTATVSHYVGWGYTASVSGSVSANFAFSLGVADGFVSQTTPNVPAGYQSGWHFFWGACDVARYEDVNLAGHYLAGRQTSLRGSAKAPTRTIPLTIAKGQRGQLVSVIGKNGPPQITITAPNGEKLATPQEAKGRPAISPHMIVFVNTASHQTFIVLGKPPAGTYEITVKPGSTPIVAVRRAGILPEPQVSAQITAGSGRSRFLHYSIRPHPGQSVQFFEQGPVEKGGGGFAALGPVQGVTKRGGVMRFDSADGLRGPRTIRALISENGLPRTELTVATYQAPGPIVPTSAGKG